jgi:oligopeptidase B
MTSLLAFAPAAFSSISEADSVKPPIAKKIHTEKNINGKTLIDDYAWLRDKKNPEVINYLKAENAYTDAIMQPTKALQDKLYKEMLGHIKETDATVPAKFDQYYYYSRTEQGKQYRIHCRKKGSTEAPEEIILDVNKLAVGQKFMSLGSFSISDDGNLLAYSTDNTGYRQYKLHIRDLRTGKDLTDTAEKTGSIVWANDNKTLFYTVEDKAKRQYQVYKHTLGGESTSDQLVFEEKDERFGVGVSKTRDKKFLFLSSHSHTTTEYRYLAANDTTGQWQLFMPRQQDIEYYLDHGANDFYIRINDKGRTFRLLTTPDKSSDKNSWKEIQALRADTMLEDVDVFKDFYVLSERFAGLPRLTVVKLSDGSKETIAMPEPSYDAFGGTNMEYDTSKFRYAYESMVTPASTFDFDTITHKSILLKTQEIPGGFDASKYKLERLYATAKDGTKVPISVVYRKDLKTEGKNPLYINGYGSYGFPMSVDFNSNNLSLLDRGVVVAIPHIRGGGDMGKPWHDDGRMMKKMNTFTDFIAATEHLLDTGYGDKNKVAIEGRSAGGLLMGAVVNLHPELYRAVVMGVPFVDVINTMLDESLPLTVGEFEEWGNPKEKPAFDYMLSYSPYDNLAKKDYPAILVRTSLNDSQVGYWEPAKYVAKLRTLKTDKHVLLFQTNMEAGHGGSSGRYDHLHEKAFEFAFILTQLGIE